MTLLELIIAFGLIMVICLQIRAYHAKKQFYKGITDIPKINPTVDGETDEEKNLSYYQLYLAQAIHYQSQLENPEIFLIALLTHLLENTKNNHKNQLNEETKEKILKHTVKLIDVLQKSKIPQPTKQYYMRLFIYINQSMAHEESKETNQ